MEEKGPHALEVAKKAEEADEEKAQAKGR